MGGYPTFNHEKSPEIAMQSRILTFLVDYYTLLFFVLSSLLAFVLFAVLQMELTECFVRGFLFFEEKQTLSGLKFKAVKQL